MTGSDDPWAEDGDTPAVAGPKDELSREWEARHSQFFNVRRLGAIRSGVMAGALPPVPPARGRAAGPCA
jgi:hypothetical protein